MWEFNNFSFQRNGGRDLDIVSALWPHNFHEMGCPNFYIGNSRPSEFSPNLCTPQTITIKYEYYVLIFVFLFLFLDC